MSVLDQHLVLLGMQIFNPRVFGEWQFAGSPGSPWHPYVLLTLLQRNFTAMGMLQLLLQALRAPHSILEAAAATTAEGSSTQAAAAPGGALRRHCGASPLPPRRRLPPGTGH